MAANKLVVLGVVGVGGYILYKYLQSSCAAQPAGMLCSFFAPGTTPTQQQAGGQTSVSTTPATTPPPSTLMATVAKNMEQVLGQTSGTTDQWNWAFSQIMGQGLDAKFGFNFAAVYGPTTGSGMSAETFLQIAARALPGGLPGLSGLSSAMARFPGPLVQTTGNMLYQAHHPLPYASTYTLKGMGAFTQPSGFERALFAGRPLSTHRAFGRRVMR